MDPPCPAKWQFPRCPCLVGLLFQLLLATSFFSYLGVSQDSPSGSPRSAGTMSTNGSCCQATTGPPAHPPLLILLWTWLFNIPVALSRCSEMLPGTANCPLTANCNMYAQADGVTVHHWDVMHSPKTQLPPSLRLLQQHWIGVNMEPPSNSWHLEAMNGYLNLTMSYRSDSDIFMPYGWLEPWQGQPAHTLVNLSAKTELVVNWRSDSSRVRYYQLLQAHIKVDYGKNHRPLPQGAMKQQLSRCKFYLAFENSQPKDCITEKLWRNALQAGTVPVVLGPRRYCECFLPLEAFIHVDNFQSPQDLAHYLQELDKDHAQYLSYFHWRETL
uniref:Fucosyltransferase n=1 Tax=Otolemur garnettii TaxID=30611 RepID=H0XFM3_OTOGA